MSTRLAPVATALAIAAALLLGGCSLLPQPSDFLGDGGSDSDSNDSSSSDDVEENPFLDHDVPDGFPSDVPLPDLDIDFSLAVSDDSWGITYKADDLESDFADIVDQYEGDGWETQMNNSSSDGALGVFTKDDYTVQVLGIADSETEFDGPGFSFTVVRTT